MPRRRRKQMPQISISARAIFYLHGADADRKREMFIEPDHIVSALRRLHIADIAGDKCRLILTAAVCFPEHSRAYYVGDAPHTLMIYSVDDIGYSG